MITIRKEEPGDIAAIRSVNEHAFDQDAEANIIEKLRKRGALTMSLVASQDDKIVGHVAFSPAIVEADDSNIGAIALGPMAVLPSWQRKGIGSLLVRAGLEECRHLGYEVVVLVGHPDYYPRFGFVPASPQGLECEFKVPDKAWMTLELQKGALAGRRGKVRFQPEFSEV
ncbi:MAG: N-acetyltransferase [Chloroflexota bacterium]|nr:N-acetyltransferase [Chloroflexota bacterium]